MPTRATIEDVLDLSDTLLDKPSWAGLTLDARLKLLTMTQQGLVNEYHLSRIPQLVKSYTVALAGGDENAQPLPEDFGRFHHVSAPYTGFDGTSRVREVQFFSRADVEESIFTFWGEEVAAVTAEGVGDDRKIIGYPDSAITTQLTVWYRPGIVEDVDLGGYAEVNERLLLDIMPIEHALRCLPYASWGGVNDAARREELRAELSRQQRDAQVRFLKGLHHAQNGGGPLKAISGFGAYRNRSRWGR